MATHNIQIKNAGGDLLMPKTNAAVVDYDKTYSALNSTTTQDAIDEIVDGVWDEGDFKPGASLITSSIWSRYVRFTVDTEEGTAVAVSTATGGRSQLLLPPGIISIRLTMVSINTFIRELSGVPTTKVKVAGGDAFGYIKTLVANKAGDVVTFTLSDRANRICIEVKKDALVDAQALLSSLEYTTRESAVPKLMRKEDTEAVVGEMCFGKPGTTPTVLTNIEDFNIWVHPTLLRYRPWVDVSGKCKLKITITPETLDTGLRVVGYFIKDKDLGNISSDTAIKYQIFDRHHLTVEYDNWKGDAQAMAINLSSESGNIPDETIIAFWESGIQFEYYDRDTKYGDYPLNVRKFNAKGDGTTDDSQALQCALDMGGTIFVPEGTYVVKTGLLIGDNTHIIMEPGAILKAVTANTSGHFCMLDTRNDVNETAYNGRHDIIIEGGIIDLNGATGTGDSVGIGLQHASRILIKNVTIKGNSGHCIDMGGCINVTIENCTFTDPQTSALKMESLQIDGTGSYGSWPFPPYTNSDWPCFDGTPCTNIEIKGCRFFQNAYSPAIGNHNRWHHRNIDIHDNLFVGPGSGAGQSRGFIAFQDGYGNETDLVLIHDNIFRDRYNGFQFQYAPKVPVGAGEEIPPNMGRIYLKNNLFINITNLISSDSTTPARYVMEGNETITD